MDAGFYSFDWYSLGKHINWMTMVFRFVVVFRRIWWLLTRS